MRLIFAGTPAFAADHLDHLANTGHSIAAVYTQPDRPAGRGKKLLPTPVKAVAERLGIAVFQPERLTAREVTELAALAPDVLVVVAYGLILSPDILAIPQFGCINVHASLLPRWRGAAPVERAILAGDTETGISIMQMDAGLDTGDILLQLATPITAADNAQTLADRLTTLGCQGLVQVLANLEEHQSKALKQNNALATYAAKLTKEDAEIHWDQPASVIQRQVQAFYPRSPAWYPFRGDRIRVIAAVCRPGRTGRGAGTIVGVSMDGITVSCGEDFLTITQIQLPGKRPAHVKDILNGRPDLFVMGASLAGNQ